MATSELLMTNGTTPATPASGKTKLFINTSKQLSIVDDAGLVTAFEGIDTVTQSTPANPTGTSSTTGVMMGLAGTFTPVFTGRALIIICGDVNNGTNADGAKFQIRFGTGSAPANAAALTGTTAGALVNYTAAAAGQKCPFSLNAIITGLTLATAVWIDIGLAAVTAGTATINDVSISVVEI